MKVRFSDQTENASRPAASSTVMPIASTAAEEPSKNSPISMNQQLQMTLERYLKSQLLSADNSDNNQSQQVQLSPSETEKLVNGLNIAPSDGNLEYYEKQVSPSLIHLF